MSNEILNTANMIKHCLPYYESDDRDDYFYILKEDDVLKLAKEVYNHFSDVSPKNNEDSKSNSLSPSNAAMFQLPKFSEVAKAVEESWNGDWTLESKRSIARAYDFIVAWQQQHS